MILIIMVVVVLFGSVMVTQVVSWFCCCCCWLFSLFLLIVSFLRIDEMVRLFVWWLFCCWCHLSFFEDVDEVLQVPVWFNCRFVTVLNCFFYSLFLRMMTRWCRCLFGLIVVLLLFLIVFFLCSCGWWRCGAGVCRRHYSTAYSGPANNRRYQMLWNALGTGNHQIWTSPSRFLERVIFKFLFLQNIQE